MVANIVKEWIVSYETAHQIVYSVCLVSLLLKGLKKHGFSMFIERNLILVSSLEKRVLDQQ